MHVKNLTYTHIFEYLPQPHEACAGLHCGLPVAHAAVAVLECAKKKAMPHQCIIHSPSETSYVPGLWMQLQLCISVYMQS